jgi:hypothetical protein
MADQILAEAKRLHAMGIDILWLAPKDKRPLEKGWSTAPRKTWAELEKLYRPGMNVGGRLASKVGFGYTVVVDVDVKSTDPKHKAEVKAFLKDRFPTLVGAAPLVWSGRGNGSAHLYAITMEPTEERRIGASAEKVKVKMPSVKPSKHETATLSSNELEAGWRLREAWSVVLMGKGRQVVLPPSIHPDSGKPYRWAEGRTLDMPVNLPILKEIPDAKGKETPANVSLDTKVKDFSFKETGLEDPTRLSNELWALLEDGEGTTNDRSADLFRFCIGAVKARLTDDEILTLTTDKQYWLGAVAYEHAKTKNRTAAARWLFNYTLNKARLEYDVKLAFAEECVETVLSPEDAEAQFKELVLDHKDWRDSLQRTKESVLKTNLHNVYTILKNQIGPALFRKNEFSGFQVYGMKAPWLGGLPDAEITDEHVAYIKKWFMEHWRIEPGSDKIFDAVTIMSGDNPFHPVKEYLDPLTWDGVKRIDLWLEKYLGAKGEKKYLRALSRKTLVAMVARIYEPGCKWDHVLILEGGQGIGKSTAIRHLAGGKWFTDSPVDINHPDGVLVMRSRWVIELGEMGTLSKHDTNQLKAFISRPSDRVRVPYGRRPEDFPRQCIFIGSTNMDEYLKDVSGNRRFWPVRVTQYDFESIDRDRDQLFAEAKLAYQEGETLYLDTDTNKVAQAEQEERMVSDSWEERIHKFMNDMDMLDEHITFNPLRFTMHELFDDGGPLAGRPDTTGNQLRAGAALRRLGFKCVQYRKGGNPQRYWVKD